MHWKDMIAYVSQNMKVDGSCPWFGPCHVVNAVLQVVIPDESLVWFLKLGMQK